MLEAEGHPVLPGLAGPISCYCWGPAGQPAAPPARDQLLLSASRQQTADHYGPLFSTNDDDTTDPTDPVTVASQPGPPVSSWASDTVSSRDNLVSLHPPYCVDWRRHLGKDETHTNKTEIFTHQTTVTLSTGRRSKFTTVGPSLAYLCPLLRVRACPSCCIAFTGLELDLVVTVVKL